MIDPADLIREVREEMEEQEDKWCRAGVDLRVRLMQAESLLRGKESPAAMDRLALNPKDALEIIDMLPKPCGGETCRDPECVRRGDLHAKLGAAADLYQALVGSYEAKVQDLARETLARSALRAQLARLRAELDRLKAVMLDMASDLHGWRDSWSENAGLCVSDTRCKELAARLRSEAETK